ncbi:HAMP domain-containing sensor histidine kinase [Lentzea sp. NPDC006480]|uniref:sensor histidine kinase n=1 Tax=Lentzea sp. NPDC006480 TaxID=3157176 RepID=UPI0033A40330
MPSTLWDLLHDLGHDLATLSCLVEVLRDDSELPERTLRKVELIDQEMLRLRDHVRQAVERSSTPGVVSVRSMAERIVVLIDEVAETCVVLRPGDDVSLRITESVLWRILKNVVDNAVRAAGPAGRVEVDAALSGNGQVVVEVADDGPGFPNGSAGWASRGLKIVTGLVAACGGSFDVRPRLPRGTCVRIVLQGDT